MAAVPQVGRATGVEQRVAPEAAATQDLYERYAGQIFSFCLHKLGSREEAEDAVQQTFLNAFRGLRRGIDVETESAWLFKIAHNVCLTRRRSAWRRGKVETPNDLESLQEYVAAPPKMGTDDLIQLQDALAAMPATQRRAILLREWQGLSYHEIAEEMEISQAAVETLIFRARRTLAQGLEKAPAERRAWRRLRHTLDLGGLLTGLVSGTVAKVAATTAAVTAFAVVPAGIEQNRIHTARAATPAPVAQKNAAVHEAPAPVLEAPAPIVAASAAPKPKPVTKPKARPSQSPAPAPAAPVADAPAPAAAPPAPTLQPVEVPKPQEVEPKVEQPQVEPTPQPQPQPPLPAPDPEQPRGDSPGKGKGKGKDKDAETQAERAPQASEPSADEAPVVEEPPAAEPKHDGGKHEDKAEKDKNR